MSVHNPTHRLVYVHNTLVFMNESVCPYWPCAVVAAVRSLLSMADPAPRTRMYSRPRGLWPGTSTSRRSDRQGGQGTGERTTQLQHSLSATCERTEGRVIRSLTYYDQRWLCHIDTLLLRPVFSAYWMQLGLVKTLSKITRQSQNCLDVDIDGLVQERRNSSALAMELRLSCTNPSL